MESFKKLIVFDVDGTLNMTEEYAIPAYKMILDKMGVQGFTDETLRERIGAVFADDIRYFFGSRAEEKEINLVLNALKIILTTYRELLWNRPSPTAFAIFLSGCSPNGQLWWGTGFTAGMQQKIIRYHLSPACMDMAKRKNFQKKIYR